MDFAAFARCVKPSWKELLDGGCESGRVRVVAAKDNYYNGPFKDDRNWVAYKLVSPDIDEILVGYCRSGSAQHRAMELLWQRGEARQARVTLELHRPPDPASAERRQFEITHVLAEDWVMSDRTLDEGL